MVTLPWQLFAQTFIVCEFIARLCPLISLNYTDDVTLECNVMQLTRGKPYGVYKVFPTEKHPI